MALPSLIVIFAQFSLWSFSWDRLHPDPGVSHCMRKP
jgi:hypothetical protein